jgi:hypothetical protein
MAVARDAFSVLMLRSHKSRHEYRIVRLMSRERATRARMHIRFERERRSVTFVNAWKLLRMCLYVTATRLLPHMYLLR